MTRFQLLISGAAAAALMAGIAIAQERAPVTQAAAPKPDTLLTKAVEADVAQTDEQLLNAGQDQDNWRLHGRDYFNQSYSPLTQITPENVTKLRPSALIQTGIANSFEATPIVVNGIMYISTAMDHVQAYDAVTGRIKWSFNPEIIYTDVCCGPQSRGVAVAYGKVFLARLDGKVTALDAKTGAVVWSAEQKDILPEPTHYYSFTMAPQVYDGMVIVGNSGAEYPTRGFVEALDANTGKLIWRFHTLPSPDQPGGKGAWSEDSWKYGGGSVWNTPAIDPKNGIITFAVGNPNPDYNGEFRKGNNLYTDSIVGIHAKDGTVAWWYQQVPHDLWDYDAVSPTMMFDVKDKTGKTVPAVGEGGKIGYVYILNRITGKLIYQSEPFSKQSANKFQVPTETPIIRYPGINGGALWSPPAFSPLTQSFYIVGEDHAYSTFTRPMERYVPGMKTVGQVTGGSQRANFEPFPATGTVTSIDVNSGKINWQWRSDMPMYGGALATGSNLLFAGEMNGNFDAFDARTGKKLWEYYMGIGVCSSPITYRVNGVQYVAVSGAGCARSTDIGQLVQPQYGDTIAIFSVPNP